MVAYYVLRDSLAHIKRLGELYMVVYCVLRDLYSVHGVVGTITIKED